METQRHRIALLIQYDGSGFNGWQVQDSGRTVQAEIEKALNVLTREKIRVTASGRTDTGVHALGQAVHFDTCKKIERSDDLRKICVSLNGILDYDVSIKNAFLVPPDFHARFSAVRREYIYLIYNHPFRNPFIIERALHVREKLDLDFLRRTAAYLKGEKDFTAFCKKTSSDVNTVRRIDEIEITESRELISFRIRGNAFLHNMVRIIIGTILKMHKEGDEPEYINEILKKRNRDLSGYTAPPCGLYLNRVFYDPPLSEMAAAY